MYILPIDVFKEIRRYKDALNLDLNGKTYDECINVIRQHCPEILSDEEIKENIKQNLHQIEKKFGYKGLRIWFHSYYNHMRNSMCGEDPLERKYRKLLPEIKKYLSEIIMKTNNMNYIIYDKFLNEVYYEEYGCLLGKDDILDRDNEIYIIMQAMHYGYWNKEVRKTMIPIIEEYLEMYNMKYYQKLDMYNIDNLSQLWLHVCEENFDDLAYEGDKMFFSDDGYGNAYMNKWENWEDEDGRKHSRLIIPEASIKGFNQTEGLPIFYID